MSVGARLAVGVLRGYQIGLSPLLPRACRFYPSCSEYSIQVVASFGLFRGIVLGLRRLGRCHPWNDGGYDPPPVPRGDQQERPIP